MICERFIKQNACEKVLFYKILISSSFKSVALKRFWENQICFVKALPFKKRNNFESISKLVLDRWRVKNGLDPPSSARAGDGQRWAGGRYEMIFPTIAESSRR